MAVDRLAADVVALPGHRVVDRGARPLRVVEHLAQGRGLLRRQRAQQRAHRAGGTGHSALRAERESIAEAHWVRSKRASGPCSITREVTSWPFGIGTARAFGRTVTRCSVNRR